MTDANGNSTLYTYQSGSLLPLTVTSGNATVSYVYDSYGADGLKGTATLLSGAQRTNAFDNE